MSKITLLSAVALSLGFSTVALASNAPAPTCYPIEHGENGMGSTNSMFLPHVFTQSNWQYFVTVTNTSDKFVNVKLDFKSPDGSQYTPYSFSLSGMFNSTNSPLSINGGAVLKPNETAKIAITDPANAVPLFGSITWQADACIDNAIVVSARSQFSDATRLGSTLIHLNNGQPF